MRIDVLVTGQYPPAGRWRMLADNLYRIEKIFDNGKHDVRIRYHSWDKDQMREKLVPENPYTAHAKNDIVWSPQPKAYNPYRLNSKFIDAPEWKDQVKRHGKIPDRGTPETPSGHITRSLQQMSTCKLIETIDDPPDLYIRIRWDAVLDHTFDYEKYIQRAHREDRVIGFQLNCDTWKKWWETRERFETHDWWEEKKETTNPLWYQRVMDHMIFFKPHRFNPEIVNHWWETKKLCAAEWGWWQILCYLTNDHTHDNINGIVPSVRHIEGQHHTS